MWDTNSAVVGIFIGFVILFLLLWLAYVTRSFIFAGTPVFYPECRSSNYFNDPSGAIGDGYSVSDILSIVDEDDVDKMYYQRVPKDLCVPGPNQTVHIRHPQYCEFTAVQGDQSFTFTGKNTFFESPFYISQTEVNGVKIDIYTGQNCIPQTNTHPDVLVTDGKPLLMWD